MICKFEMQCTKPSVTVPLANIVHPVFIFGPKENSINELMWPKPSWIFTNPYFHNLLGRSSPVVHSSVPSAYCQRTCPLWYVFRTVSPNCTMLHGLGQRHSRLTSTVPSS